MLGELNASVMKHGDMLSGVKIHEKQLEDCRMGAKSRDGVVYFEVYSTVVVMLWAVWDTTTPIQAKN